MNHKSVAKALANIKNDINLDVIVRKNGNSLELCLFELLKNVKNFSIDGGFLTLLIRNLLTSAQTLKISFGHLHVCVSAFLSSVLINPLVNL